jgi:hypothetical protein
VKRLLLVLVLAVNSFPVWADEVTPVSSEEVRTSEAGKDFRKAACLTIEILRKKDVTANERRIALLDLAKIYREANRPELCQRLSTKDAAKLKQFLEEQSQVTSPFIAVSNDREGTLVVARQFKQSLHFRWPPIVKAIKVSEPGYEQTLKKYWWFKLKKFN